MFFFSQIVKRLSLPPSKQNFKGNVQVMGYNTKLITITIVWDPRTPPSTVPTKLKQNLNPRHRLIGNTLKNIVVHRLEMQLTGSANLRAECNGLERLKKLTMTLFGPLCFGTLFWDTLFRKLFWSTLF